MLHVQVLPHGFFQEGSARCRDTQALLGGDAGNFGFYSRPDPDGDFFCSLMRRGTSARRRCVLRANTVCDLGRLR